MKTSWPTKKNIARHGGRHGGGYGGRHGVGQCGRQKKSTLTINMEIQIGERVGRGVWSIAPKLF